MAIQNLKDYYDVVIIGASFAGINCAKNLGNSDLSVLLIEKNKDIGKKVCAGGVTLNDLKYIPKTYLNFDFQKLRLYYKNKVAVCPSSDKGIISTIDREKILKDELNFLKRFNNIEILTGVSVYRIDSGEFLELGLNKKLRYKFLVGADGSNSIVRKYLNLPTKKLKVALQYKIDQKFNNFEFYFDDRLFGTAYLWIFPHKEYTYIGCLSDVRFLSPKELKSNLDLWLMKKKIDISGAKFEAASINYDYRGYRFGNVFLAGEAAGLTSGLTGKGIYSACLSGKQIAREILGQQNESLNLISIWLKKKKRQEMLLLFLKNYYLRKIFFRSLLKLLHYKNIQEKAIRFVI